MNLIDRWRQRGLKVWKAASEETSLRVSLVDRSSGLAEAWATAFEGRDGVAVLEGDLLALNCDAMVSPANSFADMGGGIDKAIDDYYGKEAQECVRRAIARDFYGELPVGMALITAYERRRFPFLISAPTMRVPGEVRGSINAYLGMRAVWLPCSPTTRRSSKAVGRFGASLSQAWRQASAGWPTRMLPSRCGLPTTTSLVEAGGGSGIRSWLHSRLVDPDDPC